MVDRVKEKEQQAMEVERQQIVIDELKAAVFEWNLEDESFYCSPSFKDYAISQESPKAIRNNRASLDTIHPDDLPELLRFFREIDAGNSRVEAVLRLTLVSGGYRWTRMVGILERDTQGMLKRAIGVIMDIEQEKKNSAKMDSLINAIPGGVAIYKIGKTIKTIYSSEGIPKLSGRTMAEYQQWVDDGIFENTIYIDDRFRVQQAVESAVSTGGDIQVIYRLNHKDGGVVWVQLLANMIGVEDGFPIYYAVYTRIPQETELYKRVVEDSTTAVFIADKQKRTILYANQVWRKIEGIPKDIPIIGRHLFDLIPSVNQIFCEEDLRALPKEEYLEYHRTHINGLYLHIYARSMDWNGIDAYILYISDATKEYTDRQALQRLVDSVPGGIGIYEVFMDRVVPMYLNEGFYRMLGWKDGDTHKGMEVLDDIHPEDGPRLRKAMVGIEEGGNSLDCTYRLKNATGQSMWVRLLGTAVAVDNGKRLLYCSFTNVDAEKNAELQYQKQMDDIDRFDADNLILKARYNLNKNQMEYRLVKMEEDYIPPEVASYDEATEVIAGCALYPEQQSEIRSCFNRRRLMAACKAGDTEVSVEYARPLSGRRLGWVELHCKTFMEPHTGEILAFIYSYDVTKRVMDQRILERVTSSQYEVLATLNLESGEFMIKNIGTDTVVRERIDLSILAERYQHHIKEVVGEEDRDALLRLMDFDKLKDLLSKNGTYSITFSKAIHGRTVRRQLRFCYLDESCEIIMITSEDITAVYQKEQAQITALKQAMAAVEKANEAKTDFLSRVSHDMRTPLNGILGLTKLMREKGDWQEIQKDITQLEMSGRYLLNLINDTLDVSKIEKGQMELHPIVCDGKAVFANTLALLRPNLEKKNITFNIQADGLPFTTLYLDVGRVEQLVMNIVGNAIKFTPTGGSIDFVMENLGIEGHALVNRIVVKDSGIGMDPEFIPQIFEPFSQEHSDMTSRYTGSGLGMTISKQIVELMGGTIAVDSTPGVGTTFTIVLKLPIATDEQKIAFEKNQPVKRDVQCLSGKRVLLCEDHPVNAQIATRLLGHQGVLVDHAKNGSMGIAMFEKSAPGVYAAILMDIRMPVMDGLEATRRIRKLDRPDARSIPIIAMTANAFEDDVKKTLEAGMDAHLAKPIEPQRLYDVLGELIEKG